ncbi:MAG: hypothetical protein AB1629_00795 [Candidatus Omnitrophota bacterium]
MKIRELEQDLIKLGLEDNINQAKLVYLCLTAHMTKRRIPILVEGHSKFWKELVLRRIGELFPQNERYLMTNAVVAANIKKEFNGMVMGNFTNRIDVDKARVFVIGLNISESAKKNLLNFQREMRTIDGIMKFRNDGEIYKKHQEFQKRIDRNISVVIPYAPRIKVGNYTTLEEQDRFLNLVETIACIEQEERGVKEKGGFKYIESGEEDFLVAKAILENTPISDDEFFLSTEAKSFAEVLLLHKDDVHLRNGFTRKTLLNIFAGKYKTIKPIEKRMIELIENGFISVVKKGGDKNRYEYNFSDYFRQMQPQELRNNQYGTFSLS